jgi:cytochrome c oxidase subunit 3
MVSVGTIVWLSSELMFFAALFAMYFSIRAAAPELWHEHTEVLNVWYALTFTTILVLSSITCQIGVFRAERGDVHGLRRWFALTFVMGLIFVLGRTFLARRFTHEQAVSAIVVSYYWHFVDVVWIGLFATIYLIK